MMCRLKLFCRWTFFVAFLCVLWSPIVLGPSCHTLLLNCSYVPTSVCFLFEVHRIGFCSGIVSGVAVQLLCPTVVIWECDKILRAWWCPWHRHACQSMWRLVSTWRGVEFFPFPLTHVVTITVQHSCTAVRVCDVFVMSADKGGRGRGIYTMLWSYCLFSLTVWNGGCMTILAFRGLSADGFIHEVQLQWRFGRQSQWEVLLADGHIAFHPQHCCGCLVVFCNLKKFIEWCCLLTYRRCQRRLAHCSFDRLVICSILVFI